MQEGAVCPETMVVCGDKEIEWKQIFALAWLFLPRKTMAWPDWFMSDNSAMGYDDLEPNLMTVLNIQRSRLRIEQVAEWLRLRFTHFPGFSTWAVK